MEPIGLEFEKADQKKKSLSNQSMEEIDTLIQLLEAAQETGNVAGLTEKYAATASSLTEKQKEIFSIANKFTKFLEKQKILKADTEQCNFLDL